MAEVMKKATRDSYGEALVELGQENPNIVVFDADLAGATKTGVFFLDKFNRMSYSEHSLSSTSSKFSIKLATGIPPHTKQLFLQCLIVCI